MGGVGEGKWEGWERVSGRGGKRVSARGGEGEGKCEGWERVSGRGGRG